MPTKKTQPKSATKAAAQKAAAPAPEKDKQVDERAQAIAELVRGGMSYSEAKAAIDNDRPATTQAEKVDLGKDPGADEEIDPDSIPDPGEDLEVVEISHEPREGYTMFETLHLIRGEIEKSREKKRFLIPIELDQRLFDWLLYGTIAEAHFRRRPDLTIEDFIEIKIKELKAADPTQGGRRDPSTSGPKDMYNPATGKWNG